MLRRIEKVEKGFARAEPHHLLSLILLGPLMEILRSIVMEVRNSNLEPLWLLMVGSRLTDRLTNEEVECPL